MAATAVYVRLQPIVHYDGVQSLDAPTVFSNISATTAAFVLRGGRYSFQVKGSTFGTVTLQLLDADATTYVTAATAVTADGAAVVELAPGTYKIAIA